MHVHGEWINKVVFLRGAEIGCIVQIARAMQPLVFSPYELPPPRTLYVLRAGIVLHGSSILTSGSKWGEDVCVDSPPDELTVPTRCMTYVEVLALSQPRLFQTVASFSKTRQLVRRSEVGSHHERAMSLALIGILGSRWRTVTANALPCFVFGLVADFVLPPPWNAQSEARGAAGCR